MSLTSFTEGAATKSFESAVGEELLKSLQHLEKELSKLRTGRAHPSMVEDLKVFAYGTLTPLKELAAIVAPEPQTLTIQPWDKSIIVDIEKAIAQSDLGVAPANDGALIRLAMPKMSGARRDELSKVLSKKGEEARVAVRTTRKDVHNAIRDAEKSKKISEDYSKRLQNLLQKQVDAAIEKIDGAIQRKEVEIKSL